MPVSGVLRLRTRGGREEDMGTGERRVFCEGWPDWPGPQASQRRRRAGGMNHGAVERERRM